LREQGESKGVDLSKWAEMKGLGWFRGFGHPMGQS